MSNLNSHELLQNYQDGNSQAAGEIFDRYIQRLISLARVRIGNRLQARIDPEDVVQSACRSFFIHAKNEEFVLNTAGDLWRLLASITLNKLHKQIEKQTAAKRSINRQGPADSELANAIAPEPTAAEIVSVVEQLHLVVKNLSPEEKIIFTPRLQGQNIEEVCELTGKSPRTVRRVLANVKQKLEQQLLHDQSSQPIANTHIQTDFTEPDAPLKFSDYTLQQLLGSGGMGKLYRATQRSIGKTVAIKALHKSRQSDARALQQFVQESQILAKLKHPQIVGVQGLGRFPAGGYFLVMDFIDGVDLQKRIDTAAFPVREAISIVSDVARAVQHAHANGIIHCDLKPANILLDKSQNVYVTDFGFAYITTANTNSSNNLIGGTTGYIAPEILLHNCQPTRAADIYALGALLWVLATTKLPNHNESLRSQNDKLKPLHKICEKCLADNPSDRFASAAELIDELIQLQ